MGGKEELKKACEKELDAVLQYWRALVDTENGGFVGRVDHSEKVCPDADKGVVLHARILWTFSAAGLHYGDERCLPFAGMAFDQIKRHFLDAEYGGVFWSITAAGRPKNTKKQVYALAFTIYGLAAYYELTGCREGLEMAIDLFRDIEKHSYDPARKGYYEAFTRDWGHSEDLRLSTKDANEKKTMNTHLHVIEAYAGLFTVWPDATLKKRIEELLYVFDAYMIDKETWHLKLFFDENWNEKPDVISYGHDIEAAWLLLWCAETIGHETYTRKFREYSVRIAEATAEGIDTDGGLWYEYDPATGTLVKEKHWWPQAELLVGMVNAWQVSGEERFLDMVRKNWGYIREYIRDHEHGEWYWGEYADHSKMKEDKAGFWKCPYHNSRACMELIKRLQR
ncbi:AGE family epimerase/isomerase [Sinomicrobium sp. M5D2P9]